MSTKTLTLRLTYYPEQHRIKLSVDNGTKYGEFLHYYFDTAPEVEEAIAWTKEMKRRYMIDGFTVSIQNDLPSDLFPIGDRLA